MHLVGFPSIQHFGSNLALSLSLSLSLRTAFGAISGVQCIFQNKKMISSWRTVAKDSQSNFIQKKNNTSLTKVDITV